jgi:lysophospholipase L1-like esterase
MRGGCSSLGLHKNRVHIKWIGISGMEWADMDTALQDHIKIGPPPNIIIIHLGANDLTTVKAKELILNLFLNIICSSPPAYH